MTPLSRDAFGRLRKIVGGPAVDPPPEDQDDLRLRIAMADPQQRFGRYILLEMAGRGGSGTVHRAYDTNLRRYVAIKRLDTIDGAPDPAEVNRFHNEIAVLAKLAHPNIVSVYDAGVENGTLYYTMEWMEGRSLEHVLQKNPLEPLTAVRLIRDIASALGEAHAVGLVHLDLKPSNILLTTVAGQDYVKLGDFGIAGRLLKPDTTTRQVRGTLSFMAPEQAAAESGEIDHRTDVFGLGATLYALITGHAPYEGDRGDLLLNLSKRCEFPRPRQRKPSLDRALERLILKAMAQDPALRFASAREIAQALDAYVSFRRLRPRRRLVALSLFIFAAGLVAWAAWPRSPAPPAREEVAQRKLVEAAREIDGVRRRVALQAGVDALTRENGLRARLLRAQLLLELGDYAECQHVLGTLPDSTELRILRVRVRIRELFAAMKFYRRRFGEFEAQLRDGPLLEALDGLASSGNPGLAGAAVHAQALLNPKRTLEDLEAILEAVPFQTLPRSVPELLLLRAYVWYDNMGGDPRNSELELAVRIDPWCGFGQLILAWCMLEWADAAKARGHAERAIAILGADEVRILRLRAALDAEAGRYASAISLLQQAGRAGETTPELRADIGTLHLLAKEPSEAIPCFTDILSLVSDDFRFHFLYACALAQIGKAEAAIDSVRTAFTLAEANGLFDRRPDPYGRPDYGYLSDLFFGLQPKDVQEVRWLEPMRALERYHREIVPLLK